MIYLLILNYQNSRKAKKEILMIKLKKLKKYSIIKLLAYKQNEMLKNMLKHIKIIVQML